MWFMVVLQVWKNWDSEYSDIMSVPVYDVDKFRAMRIAIDTANQRGYGATRMVEIWQLTGSEPKKVLSD